MDNCIEMYLETLSDMAEQLKELPNDQDVDGAITNILLAVVKLYRYNKLNSTPGVIKWGDFLKATDNTINKEDVEK